MLNFNYAKVPKLDSTIIDGEEITYMCNKKYLKWHDLIDIYVPLEDSPELLLTPRVPKPLWGVNPRSILTKIDKDWWDRTRQKVYESSAEHCRCCGLHKSSQRGYPKNLDAHECYEVDYSTGETRLKCIVPLCSSMCHKVIHYGRTTAQYRSGKLQEKTFYSILSHGNTILKNAGLPLKNFDASINDNAEYNIPWDKWCLILTIDGREERFYSLYKNEQELDEAYSAG